MGYHVVDCEALEQWDDRPADVRSVTAAAGYDSRKDPVGVRVYELAAG